MDKKACNFEDVEVRKGPWTMEEDLILINYIANHGEGVWNSLARASGKSAGNTRNFIDCFMATDCKIVYVIGVKVLCIDAVLQKIKRNPREWLKRTGKSCRLRWLNYLRPDVIRGNITPQEQLLIMELHEKWGNRWSKIAKHLPGRTDNEIKNYWRTRIQKRMKQGDERINGQNTSDVQIHPDKQISSSSGYNPVVHAVQSCSPSTSYNDVGSLAGIFSDLSNDNVCSMEEFWWGELMNAD